MAQTYFVLDKNPTSPRTIKIKIAFLDHIWCRSFCICHPIIDLFIGLKESSLPWLPAANMLLGPVSKATTTTITICSISILQSGDHIVQHPCLRKLPRSHQATSQNRSSGKDDKEGKSRQYCSQRCLLGLVNGGPLDIGCPDVLGHGNGCHPINRATFIKLMHKQLSEDQDTGCVSVRLRGARGTLLKITTSLHGYTVAAKCTIVNFIRHLKREAVIYKQLHPIQGTHVPVYLGNLDLNRPFCFDGTPPLVHMIFLSYGGVSVTHFTRSISSRGSRRMNINQGSPSFRCLASRRGPSQHIVDYRSRRSHDDRLRTVKDCEETARPKNYLVEPPPQKTRQFKLRVEQDGGVRDDGKRIWLLCQRGGGHKIWIRTNHPTTSHRYIKPRFQKAIAHSSPLPTFG